MGFWRNLFSRDSNPEWTYPGASNAAVLISTYGSPDTEQVLPTFLSKTQQAYQGNAVVFGVILARLMLFSEATFQLQSLSNKKLYGNESLRILEYPWPNGTTGELLARMEQDTSLVGNAYIWNAGDQLVRLRPDLVTIVSEQVPDIMGRPYRVVRGYYWDPSKAGDYSTPPQFFSVNEVAHWSPIPDPLANFRGMSWLSPVVRELNADNGLTDYKLRYLENAATPNMMIKYDQKIGQEQLDRVRDQMTARHGGVDNAFKTIILDEGATTEIVGNTLEQMNFTTVQAAGENRIAAAGGVPGIVVGLKEGLMAATYSNYEQAMRRFADLTMRPLWRSACAALQPLITDMPNRGVRLWYDTSDIAALRQGEKERAETVQVKAGSADLLVKSGYDLMSIVDAIESGDLHQLKVAEKLAQPVLLGKDFLGQPVADVNPAGGPAADAQNMAKDMLANGKPMLMGAKS
jgi:HK97 family phage portal protein